MRPVVFTVLALAACGDDTDGMEPSNLAGCGALETSPLPLIDVTAWPDGTPEALDTYRGNDGRWEVQSSCEDLSTAIKITSESEEAIEVVEAQYPGGLNCGCPEDPSFGADSEYPMVGTFKNFQIFIESFHDTGGQNRSLTGVGALFSPGAPLRMRGCASDSIDPLTDSNFDQIAAYFRIEQGGAMTGDIVLTNDDEGTTEVCALTDWVFIE